MTLRNLLPVLFCGSLILAGGGARAQTVASPFAERYRLEQHGGGLGVEIDESVVFLVREAPDKAPQWILERQRRDRNWCGNKSTDGKCVATDVTVHDWASSATCSYLYIYMAGFADFTENRREGESILETDTPLVTLQFTSTAVEGKPAHSLSEYSGPLAAWWQIMDDGLKSCRTTAPPVLDGYRPEARLTTPNP